MPLEYKPRKTAKRQGKRKTQGTKIEKMVEAIVAQYKRKDQHTKLNTREGVDIFVRNGIRLDLEVKSALEKTLYRYKNEHRYRMGRFTLKISDYENADLFAFVIKKVHKINNKYRWNGQIEVCFIKAETIRNYLKSRRLYKNSKNVKIGISTIRSLPKTYLKSYFKHY